MYKVRINYKIDNRIKVVEIKTGNSGFLVELDNFIDYIDFDNLGDDNAGTMVIDIQDYKELKQGRLSYAQPHSFRFRKAKGNS